ncbi:hypothetical protein LNP74_20355 [Klebsiella pneumoniae subsp. pneumoniae]|nr:hypothetical protein [Klebsiella pneumoniae subsp. pneumoniae]
MADGPSCLRDVAAVRLRGACWKKAVGPGRRISSPMPALSYLASARAVHTTVETVAQAAAPSADYILVDLDTSVKADRWAMLAAHGGLLGLHRCVHGPRTWRNAALAEAGGGLL